MRGLLKGVALTCALVIGCGERAQPVAAPPARAEASARVEVRYSSLDSVELTVRSTGAARIHLELALPDGVRAETLPITPGEVARFAFVLPDRARSYTLRVTALPPGANAHDAAAHLAVIAQVPGTQILRDRIAAAAADTERRSRLLAQILELRRTLPGQRFATGAELARVPPAALEAVVAQARRLATDWLHREHAIDAGLLESYLRVASTAMPLKADDACRLLGDAMRLSDIDAAGEVVFGRPVLDLPAAMLPLQRVRCGGDLPRTGLRPIDELKRGRLAGVLADTAFSIWTSANFEKLDAMVTLWNESVRRAIETLAVPDPADPRHARSLWYEIGTTPATFPAGPMVTIGVAATHFAPELVLWLRFGPHRAIALRSTQAGSTVVAEVPAALLFGAGHKLYARLEGFSLEDGRPLTVPREIWIVDLVVSDR